MGDVIQFRRPPRTVGGFKIVDPDDYEFDERPAAKSSTSVLKATVCQICGHPFDGQKAASRDKDGNPCTCFCHRGA